MLTDYRQQFQSRPIGFAIRVNFNWFFVTIRKISRKSIVDNAESSFQIAGRPRCLLTSLTFRHPPNLRPANLFKRSLTTSIFPARGEGGRWPLIKLPASRLEPQRDGLRPGLGCRTVTYLISLQDGTGPRRLQRDPDPRTSSIHPLVFTDVLGLYS